MMIISFTTDLTYKLADYSISNWMSCSMFQQYHICSTILVSFFSILRLKSQATEHTKRRKRMERVGFEQLFSLSRAVPLDMRQQQMMLPQKAADDLRSWVQIPPWRCHMVRPETSRRNFLGEAIFEVSSRIRITWQLAPCLSSLILLSCVVAIL